MCDLLKQVREPSPTGSYLNDSENAEMYRLHKQNPDIYTIERLAKDYRVTRQRVHAILWLKELEEEEEKKFGHPFNESVELLVDTCPEIPKVRMYHSGSWYVRSGESIKKMCYKLLVKTLAVVVLCGQMFTVTVVEFRVASLPYNPYFKVMPEAWDGTIKDLDVVHYEISRKEDEMLYQEFVRE
ncbi:hypothetical protein Pint_25984 [Pistacia integerrima]|uniref:Uncharacterized protein n=1 Tax=Pistacia integerrima TaxID=434235 RepID=A0ACC0YDK3_9ROSI|nr:hypothetical protein Pint_25984 [Pistacia integerrima]